MNKNIKIYVAGHRGLVGGAIKRELERKGYTNIVTKTINDEMKKIKVRKDEDILTAIVDWIIKVFDNYEVGYTRNIYFSRWF